MRHGACQHALGILEGAGRVTQLLLENANGIGVENGLLGFGGGTTDESCEDLQHGLGLLEWGCPDSGGAM